MLVVMEKALPESSTTEIWLVPALSRERSRPKAPCFVFGGEPAATRAKRAFGIDQGAALGEIGGIEQSRQRDRDEIGIGEIASAVGKGKPFGLGDEMGGPRAERRRAEVERLDEGERLGHGDAARGGWPHAADPVEAIGDADGLALLGAVGGQIRDGELANAARIVLHRGGDIAGDVAIVKRLGPLACDRREGLGERRIFQPVADRPRSPLGIEEIGARFRREALRAHLCEQRGKPGRDREAFAGKGDGGREQLFPGKLAVLVMGELQRRQHAGSTD